MSSRAQSRRMRPSSASACFICASVWRISAAAICSSWEREPARSSFSPSSRAASAAWASAIRVRVSSCWRVISVCSSGTCVWVDRRALRSRRTSASRSRLSSRAISWFGATRAPSSTGRSTTRPDTLKLTRTSVASMVPVAAMKPVGLLFHQRQAKPPTTPSSATIPSATTAFVFVIPRRGLRKRNADLEGSHFRAESRSWKANPHNRARAPRHRPPLA
jgi:hypothetical protein